MSAERYVFALDDSARKYAEDELNETETTREDSLAEIKKWLEENPRLNANKDDKAILPFLRGCKFRIDRTKTKIENYQKMVRDVPEWFENRDPCLKEIREMADLGVFVPLRRLCNGKLVVIIKTAAHNPWRQKQDHVLKTGLMILDIAAKEIESAQIYGVTAIFDMAGISFGHARQLTPQTIKKIVHTWQNYHCRPKDLEFINAPVYINVVLNIFKQFMTTKMKNRIKIHYGKSDSLYNVVDKSILPIEYGGEDGTLKEHIDIWEEKLISHRDWFKENEKFKALKE